MKGAKEIRIIAGAIPIVDSYTVLLVESKNGKWIFPKGGVKKEELPHQASQREAFEEGGIIGNIMESPFCIKNEITFFILNVKSVEDKYPEKSKRKRKLIKMEEALNDKHVARYVKDIIKIYLKKELED
ncbi:hypothetical protein GINT2_000128 [Glugoides intestinalis]